MLETLNERKSIKIIEYNKGSGTIIREEYLSSSNGNT